MTEMTTRKKSMLMKLDSEDGFSLILRNIGVSYRRTTK